MNYGDGKSPIPVVHYISSHSAHLLHISLCLISTRQLLQGNVAENLVIVNDRSICNATCSGSANFSEMRFYLDPK